MSTSFWKSGHVPTLFAAFLYFDLSFMVWYLLGPLAVQIAADLQLSAQQRGLMVATPILAGAILRFAMGVLVDRLSPKTAGLIGQVVVIVALAGLVIRFRGYGSSRKHASAADRALVDRALHADDPTASTAAAASPEAVAGDPS